MKKANETKELIKNNKTLARQDLVVAVKSFGKLTGQRRTPSEIALIIQWIIGCILNMNMSTKESIKYVSKCVASKDRTIEKYWLHYVEHRNCQIVDEWTLRMPFLENVLDLNEESGGQIFKLVARFAFETTIASRQGFHSFDLQARLKREGYLLSDRAVKNLLDRLNFHWTGEDEYYGQNLTDKTLNEKKRICFLKVSQALQLQANGCDYDERFIRAVIKILNQDESWGNVEMNNNFAYVHPPCKDWNTCVVCSEYKLIDADGVILKTKMNTAGKGKRVMFSHVISEDGLLNGYSSDLDEDYTDFIDDPDEKYVCNLKYDGKAARNLDKVMPTSEFLMVCGKNGGDYHDNMDADKYKKLMLNRQIPAATSHYKNEHKFVGIWFLDQAPYHVARSGFVDVKVFYY